MAAYSRKLKPFDTKSGERLVNIIVETPKGQRNKFKYDPEAGCFALSKVLPAGAVFPFDFGFVPATQAEDGDPLDVLLLMDAPAYPGTLVKGRLIGVLTAQQQESGKVIQNDRLIAVADDAKDYAELQNAEDLDANLLKEYEHFFVSYHAVNGTEFRVRGVSGPKKAIRAVKEAAERAASRKPAAK